MINTSINLVDVVALSGELCQLPIQGDLKYIDEENFVGRKIAGYETQRGDICLLAPRAAFRLCHEMRENEQPQDVPFPDDLSGLNLPLMNEIEV